MPKIDAEEIKDPVITLQIPYSEGSNEFKKNVLKCLGPSIKCNVIFKSRKLMDNFNTKSRTPMGLVSDIVYQFNCNGCNASYIGETGRHLCERVKEHSQVSRNSSIVDHYCSCQMRTGKVTIKEFKILKRSFNVTHERKVCEAFLLDYVIHH